MEDLIYIWKKNRNVRFWCFSLHSLYFQNQLQEIICVVCKQIQQINNQHTDLPEHILLACYKGNLMLANVKTWILGRGLDAGHSSSINLNQLKITKIARFNKPHIPNVMQRL